MFMINWLFSIVSQSFNGEKNNSFENLYPQRKEW
jgi:hypothetical protein